MARSESFLSCFGLCAYDVRLPKLIFWIRSTDTEQLLHTVAVGRATVCGIFVSIRVARMQYDLSRGLDIYFSTFRDIHRDSHKFAYLASTRQLRVRDPVYI